MISISGVTQHGSFVIDCRKRGVFIKIVTACCMRLYNKSIFIMGTSISMLNCYYESSSDHSIIAALQLCYYSVAFQIKPFQFDTLPKVTAGHHFGSKVIGQKIVHNPCSRSVVLYGMLRTHGKYTYSALKS